MQISQLLPLLDGRKTILRHVLKPWFSTRHDLGPGDIWQCLQISWLNGCYLHLVGRGQEATKHPIMHRTAPPPTPQPIVIQSKMSLVWRLGNPILYPLPEVPKEIEPQMPKSITCSFRHILLTSFPSLAHFPTLLSAPPRTNSHITTFTEIFMSRCAS